MICKLKLHNLRTLHTLEDLEPLFKIFYTFVCKKAPGKYTENLKQACGEIVAQVRPHIFLEQSFAL